MTNTRTRIKAAAAIAALALAGGYFGAAAGTLAHEGTVGTYRTVVNALDNDTPRPDVLDPCERVAMAMVAVRDYRGTTSEKVCFGEEDDPRVDAILTAAESATRITR